MAPSGNGVVERTEEVTMAADIPENVFVGLLDASARSHMRLMEEAFGNISSANNIVRHTAAKKFDQVDAIESSAVEKVLKANGN